MAKKPEKWIQGAIRHKGALHRELDVPQGTRIPQSRLTKALHSNNPKMRKQAVLARTLSGLRK